VAIGSPIPGNVNCPNSYSIMQAAAAQCRDAETARKPENRSAETPDGFDNPSKKRAGNSRNFSEREC